jgi:diguanylate cyclase (GGDEF)-like protein
MRKGRFAGLSDRGRKAVLPPRLGEVLLFDFLPAADEDSERVAAGRAGMLRLALPLLAAAHLLWGALTLYGLHSAGAGAEVARASAILAGVLLLDAGLWLALRRFARRPFQAVRLIAAHGLATSALLLVLAAIVSSGAGAESVTVRGALIAAAASAVPVFNTVPALMLAASAAALGVVELLGIRPPLVGIGAAVGLFLVCLSTARARHALQGARERMALEWQAKKARRFVADFEASGRGWFWETNADGILSYASAPLAAHLGCAGTELTGRRLDEVLLVDGEDSDSRRALGFHLSARFPFSDLIVRASGGDDVWWSLSGSPNFDDYGRFLGFRGLATNLSEQRRSEAETSKLARYDSLTGLPNRAMMRSTLTEALANSDARRRGCALMMIDLDKFKAVNDTLGHPIGDKLLRQVGKRLGDILGEAGQVGRLGGDEFEAILPGVEEESRLSELARRLIDEVSRPYRIEGHEIRIGTSVGIAVAQPGKATAEGVIKEADLALYAAKADGRGTFRFFAPAMHAEATERQILAADLREALARGQLALLYQPIVDSVSEEVVAFEALLRWQHPTRGLLPPSLLLPLAGETGLMPRIGEWVLRTACAEASRWPDHIRIAVNLSAPEFGDPALPGTVTRALAASGLDPERLEIEISEEVFLAEGVPCEQVLAGLRGLGVRLVLDNFGTGHSGLGHLRTAPLDKIKIDRSFIRGAAGPKSRNAAIIRAIVVLAESLGMDTTAEGAETLDELALIRRLGCSQVQGFLFGKPMPDSEALTLAEASRPSSQAAGFSRAPRHRLIRNGSLRADGLASPVRLRNISAGGAMVESDRALEAGTPVELDLDEAGLLEAEVRWCQRGQIGLRFAAEFELRALARARAPAADPAPRMMRPSYLDPRPEPQPAAAPSPLAAKKRRAR